MPGGSRSAVGPVDDKRLADLIRPAASAAGMDLESVRVSTAGKRRLVRVVVDSDTGVSLDDAAEVSRDISASLDASDVMGEVPYTLEVSSPGVTRPLTQPRHWRRAAGRLVKVKVAEHGTVTGRVTEAGDDGVTLDVDGARRTFSHGELGPGAVQVEFGKVPDRELEDLNSEDLDEDLDTNEAVNDGSGKDSDIPDEEDLGAGGDGH